MSQIHYFNPGHETAVLLGKKNYTAPTNVRKMQKDLAILPMWYAHQNDYVLIDENNTVNFISEIPKEICPNVKIVSSQSLDQQLDPNSELEAVPWGLSPHSLSVFERLRNKNKVNISIRPWKEEYFELTGRQTAAKCFAQIKGQLTDFNFPEVPSFYTDILQIEEHILTQTPPFIVKTPYSSSGRGLSWIKENSIDLQTKNWILGALNKQGAVSVEKGLEKVQDFALEFNSDGNGHVDYEGLSVFNTEERGAYSGNVLEDQLIMEKRILKYVTPHTFLKTREVVRNVLETVYGSLYKGYLGVDMIIFKNSHNTFSIHPCIEINMRCTMGILALKLFRKLVDKEASGSFLVSYSKGQREAFEHHKMMLETYPLKIENGSITKGYFSLCPVNQDTNYRAYILIE